MYNILWKSFDILLNSESKDVLSCIEENQWSKNFLNTSLVEQTHICSYNFV